MEARSGTTLVEALVALTVIALAVSGAGAGVRMGLNFVSSARLEAAAIRELDTRLAHGIPGEGTIDRGGQEIGTWQVERATLDRGLLTGAPVRWEEVTVTVNWRDRDRVRSLSARRVILLPEAGS